MIMEMMDAARVFAALSQDSRLAVLRLLIDAGPTGLPAGVCAERLRLPASTASFHLAALERADLVQSTRQGRQIVYAARFFMLRQLLAFVTELAPSLPYIAEETARMTPAFNVLFLCTHNAARSIMAEAILTKVGGERFRAFSAGSAPAEAPMPEVLAKLATLGHDTSLLHSKSWSVFTGPDAPRMDFVIALCDMLQGQVCPDFGAAAVTGAWPLPDPAKFNGSAAEVSTLLNELYASLRRRLEIFVSLPFATLDRMAMRARLDEIGAGPFVARAGAV